jgi:hypothetical protein
LRCAEQHHEIVHGPFTAGEDVQDRRRRSSATALNASAVVAARATPDIFSG